MKKFLYILGLLFFNFCSDNIYVVNTQEILDPSVYEYMVAEVESAVCSYTVPNNADFTNPYDKYSRFTLGHASDVHPFNLHAIDNLNEFISFFHREHVFARVDALMCSGDLCNGYAGRNKSLSIKEIQSVTAPVLEQNIPAMLIVGNHDSNINETGSNPAGQNDSYTQALTKEEQFKYIIENAKQKWNYINNNDKSCYYYMDFSLYKIRIICLDFVDYPTLEDEQNQGKLKYNMGYIFSQKQLEWLYLTLKNTPEDYGVITGIHHIPSNAAKWQQGTMLLNVIEAFKTGGRYVHQWNGGKYPELATNVDFDFSENGEREFICWLGGHTHRRAYSWNHNQLMITTPALFTQSYDERDRDADPTLRVSGTITQNSFNILQVDRVSKKVIVTAFGAYQDFDNNIMQRTTELFY
jgi:hypothetical protein